MNKNVWRNILSYSLWPVLIIANTIFYMNVLWFTQTMEWGANTQLNILVATIPAKELITGLMLMGVLVLFVVVCITLEWIFPYRPEWNKMGRQELNDYGHYFLGIAVSEEMARGVAMVIVGVTLPYLPALAEGRYWPREWPMFAQVILVMIIMEAGYYTYHRLMHSVPVLWKVHRFHHSSERIILTKGFRHSFFEWGIDVFVLTILMKLSGVPQEPYLWASSISFGTSLLSHANINMKFPLLLNLIFINPALHRIHHSVDMKEGNSNFGGNLMIFDVIFGTFIDARNRDIQRAGVARNTLPESFWGQYFSFLNWHKIDSSKEPLGGGK